MSVYGRAILRWEKRLASRDKNRFIRPFDWGWEWLREMPIDGLPPDPQNGLNVLRNWNARALARSTELFAYKRVRDYRLEDGRLRFTSPVQTRYAENNTVHARWFPAPGRRAVLVLPQWNSDAEGHLGLSRLFQRCGISALRMSLPYHDVRMPSELTRAEYTVDTNIGRTLHAARQAVCDARAAVDWLEDHGYNSLGILGTSLGSCYALLTTAHEPRLRVNIFNHVSAYFGDVVWTGIATRHVRQGIEPNLDQDALREAWRAISPASYLERLVGADKKVLLIYARHDPSFLPEFSRAVLARFVELGIAHESVALPCGHYTIGQVPFKFVDAYVMSRFLRRWL